jgi:hypothetical protein
MNKSPGRSSDWARRSIRSHSNVGLATLHRIFEARRYPDRAPPPAPSSFFRYMRPTYTVDRQVLSPRPSGRYSEGPRAPVGFLFSRFLVFSPPPFLRRLAPPSPPPPRPTRLARPHGNNTLSASPYAPRTRVAMRKPLVCLALPA